jgi:hypothetical protein
MGDTVVESSRSNVIRILLLLVSVLPHSVKQINYPALMLGRDGPSLCLIAICAFKVDLVSVGED